MAGGTHADHSHVEIRLGVTFTATGKPFTDAQVDAMCVQAEELVVTELPYGKTLPASADTQWRHIIIDVVINMMKIGDAWAQGGGSTQASSDAATGTFPIRDPITRSIRARIKRMMESAGGAAAGDSLSST